MGAFPRFVRSFSYMRYYEKKMKQIAVPASETYIDGNSTLIPYFGKVL